MTLRRYLVRLSGPEVGNLFEWEGPAGGRDGAEAAARAAMDLAWRAAHHELAKPQRALPWQAGARVRMLAQAREPKTLTRWLIEPAMRDAIGPERSRISHNQAVREAEYLYDGLGRAALPWGGTWSEAEWNVRAEMAHPGGPGVLLSANGAICEEGAVRSICLDDGAAAAMLAIAAGFAFTAPGAYESHAFSGSAARPRSATIAAGWKGREALAIAAASRPALAWLGNIGASAVAASLRDRIAAIGARP